MSSLFDLTGKVAVITGSSKGIGRAIAERMAEHGAKVVVSSRKEGPCEEVAAGIRAKGGDALVVPCHVAHKDQLQNLVDKTLAHFGGIDIVVGNAGINPYFGPMSGISDEVWDRIMGTNIRSNMWLANMACPHLAARGGGAFIIVSSLGGLRGSAHLGAYAVSKAADMQLARNICVEWGPKNIRANCLAPGIIRTDFARALWENPENLARRVKDDPLRRIGEPEELAGIAIYLASRAGSFTTGQNFVVDGGSTIIGQ